MRLDHAHWTVFDFLASKSDRVLATCCVIEIVAAENLDPDKPGGRSFENGCSTLWIARCSGKVRTQDRSSERGARRYRGQAREVEIAAGLRDLTPRVEPGPCVFMP
jgi:hypothetical protein